MRYVIIKDSKGEVERHEINNDVIEWAARVTAESHTMEFPDDPWEVEVVDDCLQNESASTH